MSDEQPSNQSNPQTSGQLEDPQPLSEPQPQSGPQQLPNIPLDQISTSQKDLGGKGETAAIKRSAANKDG